MQGSHGALRESRTTTRKAVVFRPLASNLGKEIVKREGFLVFQEAKEPIDL